MKWFNGDPTVKWCIALLLLVQMIIELHDQGAARIRNHAMRSICEEMPQIISYCTDINAVACVHRIGHVAIVELRLNVMKQLGIFYTKYQQRKTSDRQLEYTYLNNERKQAKLNMSTCVCSRI